MAARAPRYHGARAIPSGMGVHGGASSSTWHPRGNLVHFSRAPVLDLPLGHPRDLSADAGGSLR